MNKVDVLKKLEKHKDECKDYSNYALMNEGYRSAMMDAIDLVKKLTIPVVVLPKGTLCACGLTADGTLYGKPMCEGCLHRNT
jgi:hypothetical protein